MNKLAFLTMIAASAVFFACGNEFSSPFYDQLTDEQKEMVSIKGFKIKDCIAILFNDADSVDVTDPLTALKLDLLQLSRDLPNAANIASLENVKTTMKPFPALTLEEPFDDNKHKLLYYYDAAEKTGFAVCLGGNGQLSVDQTYEIEKKNILSYYAECGLLPTDWQTSTTAEEQLIWFVVHCETRPKDVSEIFKFSVVTVDGKPYHVTTVLGQ